MPYFLFGNIPEKYSQEQSFRIWFSQIVAPTVLLNRCSCAKIFFHIFWHDFGSPKKKWKMVLKDDMRSHCMRIHIYNIIAGSSRCSHQSNHSRSSQQCQQLAHLHTGLMAEVINECSPESQRSHQYKQNERIPQYSWSSVMKGKTLVMIL